MGSTEEGTCYGFVDVFKTPNETVPYQTYQLFKRCIKVGRDHCNEIRIHNLKVSRLQCVISIHGEVGNYQVRLENKTDKRTTVYKNEPVPPKGEVIIYSGDRFRCHEMELQYRDSETELEESEEGTRTPIIKVTEASLLSSKSNSVRPSSSRRKTGDLRVNLLRKSVRTKDMSIIKRVTSTLVVETSQTAEEDISEAAPTEASETSSNLEQNVNESVSAVDNDLVLPSAAFFPVPLSETSSVVEQDLIVLSPVVVPLPENSTDLICFGDIEQEMFKLHNEAGLRASTISDEPSMEVRNDDGDLEELPSADVFRVLHEVIDDEVASASGQPSETSTVQDFGDASMEPSFDQSAIDLEDIEVEPIQLDEIHQQSTVMTENGADQTNVEAIYAPDPENDSISQGIAETSARSLCSAEAHMEDQILNHVDDHSVLPIQEATSTSTDFPKTQEKSHIDTTNADDSDIENDLNSLSGSSDSEAEADAEVKKHSHEKSQLNSEQEADLNNVSGDKDTNAEPSQSEVSFVNSAPNEIEVEPPCVDDQIETQHLPSDFDENILPEIAMEQADTISVEKDQTISSPEVTDLVDKPIAPFSPNLRVQKQKRCHVVLNRIEIHYEVPQELLSNVHEQSTALTEDRADKTIVEAVNAPDLENDGISDCISETSARSVSPVKQNASITADVPKTQENGHISLTNAGIENDLNSLSGSSDSEAEADAEVKKHSHEKSQLNSEVETDLGNFSDDKIAEAEVPMSGLSTVTAALNVVEVEPPCVDDQTESELLPSDAKENRVPESIVQHADTKSSGNHSSDRKFQSNFTPKISHLDKRIAPFSPNLRAQKEKTCHVVLNRVEVHYDVPQELLDHSGKKSTKTINSARPQSPYALEVHVAGQVTPKTASNSGRLVTRQVMNRGNKTLPTKALSPFNASSVNKIDDVAVAHVPSEFPRVSIPETPSKSMSIEAAITLASTPEYRPTVVVARMTEKEALKGARVTRKRGTSPPKKNHVSKDRESEEATPSTALKSRRTKQANMKKHDKQDAPELVPEKSPEKLEVRRTNKSRKATPTPEHQPEESSEEEEQEEVVCRPTRNRRANIAPQESLAEDAKLTRRTTRNRFANPAPEQNEVKNMKKLIAKRAEDKSSSSESSIVDQSATKSRKGIAAQKTGNTTKSQKQVENDNSDASEEQVQEKPALKSLLKRAAPKKNAVKKPVAVEVQSDSEVEEEMPAKRATRQAKQAVHEMVTSASATRNRKRKSSNDSIEVLSIIKKTIKGDEDRATPSTHENSRSTRNKTKKLIGQEINEEEFVKPAPKVKAGGSKAKHPKKKPIDSSEDEETSKSGPSTSGTSPPIRGRRKAAPSRVGLPPSKAAESDQESDASSILSGAEKQTEKKGKKKPTQKKSAASKRTPPEKSKATPAKKSKESGDGESYDSDIEVVATIANKTPPTAKLRNRRNLAANEQSKLVFNPSKTVKKNPAKDVTAAATVKFVAVPKDSEEQDNTPPSKKPKVATQRGAASKAEKATKRTTRSRK